MTKIDKIKRIIIENIKDLEPREIIGILKELIKIYKSEY